MRAAATGSRIVAEVAAAHGGRFAACAHAAGASAVLELPLAAALEPRRSVVSRRARAVGFAAAAAICAGLAAARRRRLRATSRRSTARCARSWSRRAAAGAGDRLGRDAVAEALEVRRVPERFVPPDALDEPGAGARPPPGRRRSPPAATCSRSSSRPPRRAPASAPAARRGGRPGRDRGRRAPARSPPVGPARRPRRRRRHHRAGPGGGPGRTYVAARGVSRCSTCAPAAPRPTGRALPGRRREPWVATLALNRAQALRLIHAQSFARELRLIGR